MPKNTHDDEDHYGRILYALQVELVKLQRRLIAENERVLVIFEGRDGAGKDGAIKRLTEHMSPRETRIHAPGKPSDREVTQWYFERFVRYLPSGGEFVVFNRSWYNRAGVEIVMGFCSKDDVKNFYDSVVPFEEILVRDGIHVRKYYLDITKKEQKTRLAARKASPLKHWKTSPIDEAAQNKWKDYSKARDAMLKHTSHALAPWTIVRSDDKKIARLELLRDLLSGFKYKHKDEELVRPDREIIFHWSEATKSELAR